MKESGCTFHLPSEYEQDDSQASPDEKNHLRDLWPANMTLLVSTDFLFEPSDLRLYGNEDQTSLSASGKVSEELQETRKTKARSSSFE